MSDVISDQFPALQGRRTKPIEERRLGEIRRILNRAFQNGVLSEGELASTLDRLTAGGSTFDPHSKPTSAEDL
jgi:hypothetical protein